MLRCGTLAIGLILYEERYRSQYDRAVAGQLHRHEGLQAGAGARVITLLSLRPQSAPSFIFRIPSLFKKFKVRSAQISGSEPAA